MIVPHSIALETQTWMEEKAKCLRWLPGSPPGMCRHCALAERVCVQVRNKHEAGAPPKPVAGAGAGAQNRERARQRAQESGAAVRADAKREGRVVKSCPSGLDYRHFS